MKKKKKLRYTSLATKDATDKKRRVDYRDEKIKKRDNKLRVKCESMDNNIEKFGTKVGK